MDLHCLGASREVGRSCFSLNLGEKSVFLDCGVKTLGDKAQWQLPTFKGVKKPSAVVLTHAHLDHSGALPVVQKHSSPFVFMTRPTAPVVDILLKDAMKIAHFEKQTLPFSSADFTKLSRNTRVLNYNEEFKIGMAAFELLDAGHVIGSSQVQCTFNGKTLLYTGDFKTLQTRMHLGRQLPKVNVDVLVIESTYARKVQEDRRVLEKRFCAAVKKASENGVVLIAAFALGRTQEILSILQAGEVKNIYVQGMGSKINNVYYDFSKFCKNEEFKKVLNKVEVIKDRETQKKAFTQGNVIVCTSGMLEGGPILSLIEKMQRENVNGKIFLTGFQIPKTNGHKLLNSGKIFIKNKNPIEELKITKEFELFEFSAHAGKTELYDYVRKVNPEKVICIHGEDAATQEFASNLKEEGFNAISPKIGDKIKC